VQFPWLTKATQRGLAYLAGNQRPDGSWLPLWFGNQHRSDDENPLYGTARVLLAYRDLRLMDTEPARRALAYLVGRQNHDGGWGGGPVLDRGLPVGPARSSVEETALVIEALLANHGDPSLQAALTKGLSWLVETVETGRFREASPIGFYFAKLWYYEKLYPIIFTVSALGQAIDRLLPPPPEP
jgi:squalene-hopene/tetraprenyl-beta-curcumene cyclase